MRPVARSTRPRATNGSEPSAIPSGERIRPTGPPPFKDILCAVDGSRGSKILLATDGSPGSWAAARTATRLSQAHGSELRLVYVPDGMHPEHYREVLKQMTAIGRATGSSPPVIDDPGHVTEQILKAADATRTSLIVIGHRGVPGVKALGSVSERIVNRAPCSFLVVPAGGEAA